MGYSFYQGSMKNQGLSCKASEEKKKTGDPVNQLDNRNVSEGGDDVSKEPRSKH